MPTVYASMGVRFLALGGGGLLAFAESASRCKRLARKKRKDEGGDEMRAHPSPSYIPDGVHAPPILIASLVSEVLSRDTSDNARDWGSDDGQLCLAGSRLLVSVSEHRTTTETPPSDKSART